MKIDFAGLADRVTEVPVPAGNYGALQATEKRLCWVNAADEMGEHQSLQCLDIANKGDEADTVMGDVRGFEISADRKKMLIAKKEQFYIFDADAKSPRPQGAGQSRDRPLPLGHHDQSARGVPRASFWMHGGWSATTSTTATCMAWIGRRCATATCRWWIAWPTATSLTM